MRKEAKRFLKQHPIKPMEAGLYEKVIFNLRYCILDYGRLNTRV
jgi:hypothetical protein